MFTIREEILIAQVNISPRFVRGVINECLKDRPSRSIVEQVTQAVNQEIEDRLAQNQAVPPLTQLVVMCYPARA